MKILVSSYYLDLSGVPTYTLTMVNELRQRGHDVEVYTIEGGALAKPLGAVKNTARLSEPDVIIAQSNACAYRLRYNFPDTPMIFMAHGVTPQLEQPPEDIAVQRYTAINEDTAANLQVHGVPVSQIEIVRDFVDLNRFEPKTTPGPFPKRVLFISNFRKGKTLPIISDACEKLGLTLTCVGAPYGRTGHVEKIINQNDLVISTGRGILEGMACGRPVLSFGQERGDGYLTHEVYLDSRTRNFAGLASRFKFDVDMLAKEIWLYKQSDSFANRQLAMQYHNSVEGVTKILSICEGIL
jgi:glycosyltransferase involved in cell wall biosynthesis